MIEIITRVFHVDVIAAASYKAGLSTWVELTSQDCLPLIPQGLLRVGVISTT